MFWLEKRCEGCTKSSYRKRFSPVTMCNPYLGKHTSHIFGQIIEDINNHHEDRHAKAHCVAATTECNGPSRHVHKHIAYCRNNLFVLGLPPLDKVELDDLPLVTRFDRKTFNLIAAIGGNGIHFVSYIKRPDCWIFYDGMGRDARGAQNLMIRITTSSSRLMKFKVKKYPICEVFYEQIEDDNDEEDDFSPTQDNSTSGTIHKKEEIDLFLTDSEDECGLDDLADENNLFDGNNDLTSTQELPNNKTHEKVKKTLKILSSKKSGKSITTISRTKYNSKKSKNSKVKHSELKPEKVTPNFQKKNSKVDCEKARLQSFNIAGTKESKKQQLSAVKRLRSGKKLRK
mmetsp:Transcript_46314/g.49938  ORF Transcript_46314/g.49938 Transcript_46314/m.49938 type:complete len:343 (+) Transcript_46314:731-1759(+)